MTAGPMIFWRTVAGVAVLATAAPAAACMPTLKTREQLRRNATLAVVANARISTTTMTDSVWVGTVALDVSKIVRNRRSIAIPRVINVAFAISLDTDDCGRWVPDEAATFYTLDIEDGRFVVRAAL